MQRSGGFDHSWASSTDEAYQEQLRLIVTADGFLGPANRRQVFDAPTGPETCGYPNPKTPDPKRQLQSAISRLPGDHPEDD